MYTKFLYILLGCMCQLAVLGQPSALQSIHKLAASAGSLAKNNDVAAVCKKQVVTLHKELKVDNEKALTASKIRRLAQALDAFASFRKAPDGKLCTGRLMTQFSGDATALSVQLKTLARAGEGSNGLTAVLLSVVDSASGKTIDGSLRIDSAGTLVSRVSYPDSAGYRKALLQINTSYQVSASATGYRPYVASHVFKEAGQILRVGLVRGPMVGSIDKPAEPAMTGETRSGAGEKVSRRAKGWWYFAAAIAAALLVIVAFLYARLLSSAARIGGHLGWKFLVNPALAFRQEIARKNMLVNELNTNLEVVEASLAIAKKQKATEAIPADEGIAPADAHAQGYFLSEVLMTAGPRKKFLNDPQADKDLGEDVCGFIASSNEVLCWVIDGTSDVHCLIHPETGREYFSSRLQAQSIAEKLRAHFWHSASSPMQDAMKAAIQAVRTDWVQTLASLPETEKQRLRNAIEKQNLPECSVTLLLCRLALNGRFTGYRSGDSKMFLFGDLAGGGNELRFIETPLADKNPASNDRMFFRIQLDDAGDFDVLANEPLFEIVSEENVRLVIGMSDGVGSQTEQTLRDAKSAEGVRNKIVLQSQGTADDKSICFLEIRKTDHSTGKPPQTESTMEIEKETGAPTQPAASN